MHDVVSESARAKELKRARVAMRVLFTRCLSLPVGFNHFVLSLLADDSWISLAVGTARYSSTVVVSTGTSIWCETFKNLTEKLYSLLILYSSQTLYKYSSTSWTTGRTGQFYHTTYSLNSFIRLELELQSSSGHHPPRTVHVRGGKKKMRRSCSYCGWLRSYILYYDINRFYHL